MAKLGVMIAGGAALAVALGFGATSVKVGGKTAAEVFADSRVAALADAAARGDVAEVDRLIAAGAPVDGTGGESFTPLKFALLATSKKGVEALLKRGANPNRRTPSEGWVGGLPTVMLLPSVDLPEILDLMLQYGADPNTRFPVRQRLASEFPFEGESLLIKASMGSIENVKVLLKHGADVNLCPKQSPAFEGGSPAVVVAARVGRLDIVELLLDHGATRGLDDVAVALQSLRHPADAEAQRVAILRRIHRMGAKIYAHRVNPGTPAELLTAGETPPWVPCSDDKPVKIPDTSVK